MTKLRESKEESQIKVSLRLVKDNKPYGSRGFVREISYPESNELTRLDEIGLGSDYYRR